MTGDVETVKKWDWVVPLVLAVLFCAWLFGVPYLLLRSLAAGSLMGEPVSDASLAESAAFATAAGWTAVLVPVAGAILALFMRQKGWAVTFGVTLGLTLLVIGYSAFENRNNHPRPTSTPGPTHCVERSGGGNECPGDI